jgi:hypothetical protein
VRDSDGRAAEPSATVPAVTTEPSKPAVAAWVGEVESGTTEPSWPADTAGLGKPSEPAVPPVAGLDRGRPDRHLPAQAEQSDAGAPVITPVAAVPAATAATSGSAAGAAPDQVCTAEDRTPSAPAASASALSWEPVASVPARVSLPALQRDATWAVRALAVVTWHAIGADLTCRASDAAVSLASEAMAHRVWHRLGLTIKSVAAR